MYIDYVYHLTHLSDLGNDFKDSIIHIYFGSGQRTTSILTNYCDTTTYQDYFLPIKQCVELWRLLKPRSINQHDMKMVNGAIAQLDDSSKSETLERFNLGYNVIYSRLQEVEIEMSSIFSSFDLEESKRINEAMHAGLEGCNYSCVAMSVSAVESRLYKLMTLAKPDSTSNLNKMTLGQLIKEYSENEGSYQNIVPDKHDALLVLFNTYRIFSVHPKREHVSGGIATSILNLSIAFLSDPDSTPESVKTKLATK